MPKLRLQEGPCPLRHQPSLPFAVSFLLVASLGGATPTPLQENFTYRCASPGCHPQGGSHTLAPPSERGPPHASASPENHCLLPHASRLQGLYPRFHSRRDHTPPPLTPPPAPLPAIACHTVVAYSGGPSPRLPSGRGASPRFRSKRSPAAACHHALSV